MRIKRKLRPDNTAYLAYLNKTPVLLANFDDVADAERAEVEYITSGRINERLKPILPD